MSPGADLGSNGPVPHRHQLGTRSPQRPPTRQTRNFCSRTQIRNVFPISAMPRRSVGFKTRFRLQESHRADCSPPAWLQKVLGPAAGEFPNFAVSGGPRRLETPPGLWERPRAELGPGTPRPSRPRETPGTFRNSNRRSWSRKGLSPRPGALRAPPQRQWGDSRVSGTDPEGGLARRFRRLGSSPPQCQVRPQRLGRVNPGSRGWPRGA